MGFSAYAPRGGAGGIGAVPTRASTVLESIGNILAFPFKDDALDKSGNGQVIGAGTASLITQDPAANPDDHYTYDAQPMLRCTATVGFVPIITADSQAHQVPLSEPLSFGFFYYVRSATGTPEFMYSGPSAGGNTCNYGVQRQASVGWRSLGGGGVTAMGDHRDITPFGRWSHIVVVHSGSRSSSHAGAFYVNGVEVWNGNLVSSAPLSTHDFSFNDTANATNSDFEGFMCNAFVTDTLLDAATIKALSDESFGHGSPYAPSI